MSHSPGQVYRWFDRPAGLLVVLSAEDSNRDIGRVTVCPFNLTDAVGNLPHAARLHSLLPSPGYIAWTLHFTLIAGLLTEHVGEVETAPLFAARFAIEGHFGF